MKKQKFKGKRLKFQEGDLVIYKGLLMRVQKRDAEYSSHYIYMINIDNNVPYCIHQSKIRLFNNCPKYLK